MKPYLLFKKVCSLLSWHWVCISHSKWGRASSQGGARLTQSVFVWASSPLPRDLGCEQATYYMKECSALAGRQTHRERAARNIPGRERVCCTGCTTYMTADRMEWIPPDNYVIITTWLLEGELWTCIHAMVIKHQSREKNPVVLQSIMWIGIIRYHMQHFNGWLTPIKTK